MTKTRNQICFFTVLPEIDENLVNNLNIEINGHITSEEILHCVKNLKNEKACGDDIIKNEYIKKAYRTKILSIVE
jgi:hypothetical protein